MEARLWPLNALIALLKGDGGWPRPLGDLGFALHRIELPVVTSAGGIVIDVVASRDHPAALLACEGKSGNNVEEPQAIKYKALTTDDVRRLTGRVSGPTHVVYACFEASLARIRLGLAKVGLDANILTISERRAQLIPSETGAELAFEELLPGTPPPRYIPVDGDSPDEEYREVLLPAIVASAARSIDRLTVQTLCESTMPMWTHVGRDQARRVHERSVDVLTRLAATAEFRNFFSIEPGGRDLSAAVVRILRTPAAFDPRGETQGWQGIQRRATKVMRGRGIPVSPGQLSFEDLAQAEGVGPDE